MTENEAINELQANIDLPFGFTVSDEVSEVAIQALEEIQQYRAIGTVEDWQKLIKKEATERRKLEEYFMLGSVEEFKALKDSQRKCEDCAGCTNWKCDCANIRDKAISDFLLKICEKYTEEEQKGNYSHLCCNIKQDIADIAEQMKGGAEVFQMPSDEEVEV